MAAAPAVADSVSDQYSAASLEILFMITLGFRPDVTPSRDARVNAKWIDSATEYPVRQDNYSHAGCRFEVTLYFADRPVNTLEQSRCHRGFPNWSLQSEGKLLFADLS